MRTITRAEEANDLTQARNKGCWIENAAAKINQRILNNAKSGLNEAVFEVKEFIIGAEDLEEVVDMLEELDQELYEAGFDVTIDLDGFIHVAW